MTRDYQKDLARCSAHLSSDTEEMSQIASYYIKRCMELEAQLISLKEDAAGQQQLVCNVLRDMEDHELIHTKANDELLKQLGRERLRVQELEMQVGMMREALEKVNSLCNGSSFTYPYLICRVKREVNNVLQSPTPARWEKMQLLERQLEIASKEITDANSSIGDYGDLCPAEYDNSIKCSCSGTISDVWECWRKRWRDKALADLEAEGGGE